MAKCHWIMVLLAAGTLSAVVNAVEDKEIKDWGTIADPDKDCTIKEQKGALAITVPATSHDLGIEHQLMNAPRVLRKVSGDFTVQVLVSGRLEAEPPRTLKDRLPFMGAGLLLWQDENNYIRLERASLVIPMGNREFYASFELRKNGKTVRSADSTDFPLLNKDQYLRLERRGENILAAVSEDGKKWETLNPMKVEFPKDLQVGVAAVNTSAKVLDVQFKSFKVTQKEPAAEKAKNK
jgi:regulation of enolase protein 1 (concanavalin A-like superfamily)